MLNSRCPRISWTSFRFRPRITNQDAQVWRRSWKRKPNKVERRQRPLPVHRPTDRARDRRHLGQRRQGLAVHRLEDRGHGIQLGASMGPVRRGIALDGDGAVQLPDPGRVEHGGIDAHDVVAEPGRERAEPPFDHPRGGLIVR